MRLLPTTFIATLALAATVVLAADATDPTAKARQELMDTIAMNVKVLGDMAGGKAAFDAAAATAAKDALVAASAEIPAKFETEASDPKSNAKPAVWTSFADFTTKAKALNTAVTALDTASLETVQAGMGAVGGACKDCHTTYKN